MSDGRRLSHLLLARHLEVFVPKPNRRSRERELLGSLDDLLFRDRIPMMTASLEACRLLWDGTLPRKISCWENIVFGYSTYQTDGHFRGGVNFEKWGEEQRTLNPRENLGDKERLARDRAVQQAVEVVDGYLRERKHVDNCECPECKGLRESAGRIRDLAGGSGRDRGEELGRLAKERFGQQRLTTYWRESTLVIKFLLTNYATVVPGAQVSKGLLGKLPEDRALTEAENREHLTAALHLNDVGEHIIGEIERGVLWGEEEVWSHSWYTVLDRRCAASQVPPIVLTLEDRETRFGEQKERVLCVVDYVQDVNLKALGGAGLEPKRHPHWLYS